MGFFAPHRIIGLDIGSDTMKAVQITSGFKGFKVTGFAKRKREDTQPRDFSIALSAEIQRMLQEESLEGDVFICSISCNSVSVRNLKLPFPNINKVRQVIKYEVESLLPFLLDDVIVDFSIINRKPREGTDLLVMAAQKGAVKEHLEIMKGAGIEPEIVDLDSSSPFYCLEAVEDDKKDGIVSIIDIGAKKTSVIIVKNGVLQLVRGLPVGGEAITKAVSEELSIDMNAAEELKRKEGTILFEHIKSGDGNIGGESPGIKVSKAIIDTLEKLKRDVALSFSFYQALYSDEKIGEVLLTGGTSNIGNIDKYFEREFRIKTAMFNPLQFTPNTLGDIGRQNETIITGALGLALKGARGSSSRINFRKEEYVYKRKDADIRKNLMFILIGLSLVFCLFVGNLFTKLYLKERRYTRIKTDIRQIFTETFPDVKNIVNELQQMKKNILEEKDKNISIKGLHRNVSFLDILRELSVRIPAGKDIKIIKTRMNDESISIVGEANSFDTVDKMQASLKQSRLLKGIDIKDAKMSARKGVVSFDLRMEIAE